MLTLMVVSEEQNDVVALDYFFKWKKLEYTKLFSPDKVKYLNQGSDEPLLMDDNEMIAARGLYDIIEFIKTGKHKNEGFHR